MEQTSCMKEMDATFRNKCYWNTAVHLVLFYVNSCFWPVFPFLPSCAGKQQCLWSHTKLSLAVRDTKPFSATQHKGCSAAVPCCGHCSTSCPGSARSQATLLKSQPCPESSSDGKTRASRSCCLFWSGELSGKLLSCEIPSHTFNFGRSYRIQLVDTRCGVQIPEFRHPTSFEALQEI